MFFLALAGAPWLYVNKHMCDMWNDDRHQEPNGHKIEFDPESNWKIFDSFLFKVILFINLWSFANLQMLQWCMLSIMSPDLWCQWQATNDVCFKPKTTHNSRSVLKITRKVSFYIIASSCILLLISSWNDGESRQSRENAKQKYLAAACKLQVLDSKRDKMPASIKMIFDRT